MSSKCVLEFWGNQGRVMGQWFHFWLNPFCLQPMPLACLCSHHASYVCFQSCPKADAFSSDHFSCIQWCVWFWLVWWCCNSTAPTPTVPPSVCSSCAHSPCPNTINHFSLLLFHVNGAERIISSPNWLVPDVQI